MSPLERRTLFTLFRLLKAGVAKGGVTLLQALITC
jgi:hypothetical protein